VVDIIIPVLNEEKILTEKAPYYSRLGHVTHIIFVDGGSSDRTAQIACRYGEVVSSRPGRALQKNFGAQRARSNHLLFLHVDTFISEGSLKDIDRVLEGGVAGGCLTMRIDDKGWIFRMYEWAVNVRAKAFRVMDGDLGAFVRRDVFDAIGGFDLLPVMEDITFGRKLRAAGRVDVLPEIICVSSRKWRERGFVRTFLDYAVAYIKFWTGQLEKRKSDCLIPNEK
jgi:rSAM/selenodomain-associated transferase 2